MANCLDCLHCVYCVHGPLYNTKDVKTKREGFKCLLKRFNMNGDFSAATTCDLFLKGLFKR